jgi:nitrogenase molybdenum-iron protein alpha chain
MSYWDQSVPPVRDERLVIGDSFAGCGGELLDCAKSGCLFKKNRSFWQSNACHMALTLMMAVTVENAVIVMHGPKGCGAQLHQLGVASAKGKGRRKKKPAMTPWLTTNIDENDIIRGAEKKLRETILAADRDFHPEIIFVVATCAPSIIGDDIEDVVIGAAKSTAAEVVSLHCPGFKSRVVASAYDAFYHGLIKRLSFEPVKYVDYQPIEPGDQGYESRLKDYLLQKQYTVNVFNATSIGVDDENEIVRLLNALGLKARIFAEYCDAAELRTISEAALNVSMCNVHDDYILTFLKEKYGTPYVIAGMPVGFESTKNWLLTIAEHFDLRKRAENLIYDEEERLRAAIKPLIREVEGKSVLLCGGVVRSGSEAMMFREFGMKVLGIRLYHYDNGAEPVIRETAEQFPGVPMAVSNQLFEQLNQVRQLKPDLVVSHAGTQGPLAKAGVNAVQIFDADKAYFGYTGLYRFLRRIAFSFKNDSYQRRLAEHVSLPYKDSWWSKDPYHYIKG